MKPFFNPRNLYQNYNCAVNLSDKIIYTYMGVLKPELANANYCSAGQLSPLLNDPLYKTAGIGTRIYFSAEEKATWSGRAPSTIRVSSAPTTVCPECRQVLLL